MGYYTRFEIKTNEPKVMAELLEKEIGSYGETFDYLFDNNGDSYDCYKWYDHETDMKEVSKEFPGVLFTLKGEGEAAGDLWLKYFKDGKIQRCHAKITFDEFDESKLA